MDDWNEKQKAVHAKTLLEDPMLAAFFRDGRLHIFERWERELDPAQRETLWQRQQALDWFKAYLYDFIATGTLLTHAEQERNGQ